jgi:hypothetical protein
MREPLYMWFRRAKVERSVEHPSILLNQSRNRIRFWIKLNSSPIISLRGQPCRSTRSASQSQIDSESPLQNYALPDSTLIPLSTTILNLIYIYIYMLIRIGLWNELNYFSSRAIRRFNPRFSRLAWNRLPGAWINFAFDRPAGHKWISDCIDRPVMNEFGIWFAARSERPGSKCGVAGVLARKNLKMPGQKHPLIFIAQISRKITGSEGSYVQFERGTNSLRQRVQHLKARIRFHTTQSETNNQYPPSKHLVYFVNWEPGQLLEAEPQRR